MSNLDSQQRQPESLKMRWQERRLSSAIEETQKNSMASANLYYGKKLLSGSSTPSLPETFVANPKKIQIFPGCFDDDLVVSTVVPPVTVVLEGRSICQRISLHKHAGYQSLAKALRQMFVDNDDGNGSVTSEGELDLSDAIPGHLIAYEDMENDLLLVGDLKWNDFVRVAKRIRIIPVKANSRKGRVEN